MRLSATRAAAIAQSRGLGNLLWDLAGAPPSLDLRFAENKSLVDATTGQNLVTFTRASGATYVDSQGVIRPAVTNLLLRSEEFDNASWGKTNATVTANSIAAPNGTVTADQLIENTSNGFHRISQVGNVSSGLTYTFSVYIKTAGRTRVTLQIGSTPFAQSLTNFDLQTGTVASGSGAVLSLGDGWFRCSATNTATSTGAGEFFVEITDSSGNRQYTGDGTSGIYLWGAQLEQSSTVGEYIPTTSTINSAPRFDHNPVTGESLGLLVEEQRTNSIRNNTMAGAVAGTPGTLPTNWTRNAGAAIDVNVIGSGIEDGIQYLDVQFTGTPSVTGTVVNVRVDALGGVPALNGQTWTFSSYLKLVSGSLQNTSVNLQLGEFSSTNIFLAGTVNTIVPTSSSLRTQRFVQTRLFSQATTAFACETLFISYTNGLAIDFTLRIGLPQLEQGAFATSVIPTTGTAATRSADVASISGSNFDGWYNAAKGTAFTSFSTPVPASISVAAAVISFDDGTANNRFSPCFYVSNVGQVNANQLTAAASDYQLFGTGAGGAILANIQKAATSLQFGNYQMSVNGLTPASNSAAVGIPTVNTFRIGIRPGGAQANATIRRFTYWPQALPGQLQAITQ